MSNDGPSNPEGLVFRDWKQDEGQQPASGGEISPGGLVWLGDDGPEKEMVYLSKDAPVYPNPFSAHPFKFARCMTDEQARTFIREEVTRQLGESSGIVSVREYIRVVGKTHDGRTVRGMLHFEDEYATDPEMPAAQERVPGGTCWACGTRGESTEMMWYNPAPHEGKRSHLIHATAECIRAAALKPEEREHHG